MTINPRTTIERFEGYAGRGRPTLRAWKHPKTMTVEWNDCGMSGDYSAVGCIPSYVEFARALDSAVMNAELLAVWKRHRPACGRRASFSHGDVGGALCYVPHAAGVEAMDIIRRYYGAALAAIGPADWRATR